MLMREIFGQTGKKVMKESKILVNMTDKKVLKESKILVNMTAILRYFKITYEKSVRIAMMPSMRDRLKIHGNCPIEVKI